MIEQKSLFSQKVGGGGAKPPPLPVPPGLLLLKEGMSSNDL